MNEETELQIKKEYVNLLIVIYVKKLFSEFI